jgi:hypothetical protein
MKKLLATTAIVSVSLASAAIAETKVSGSIEQTIKTLSYDKAASEVNGSRAIGQETNVTFSTSGELDNGMKINGAFRSEDGTIDMSMIKISGENASVAIGADFGKTINDLITPVVGDRVFYVVPGVSDGVIATSAHDVQHLGLEAGAGGFTFAVNYAPSSAGISTGDSATTDSGGSHLEYLVTGKPMEGLEILIGKQTSEGDDSTTLDVDETTAQIAYSSGQYAIGYAYRKYDDGGAADSATQTEKVTNISATYSVNDQVSLGIQHQTAESETGANDEVQKSIAVGYNLGPIGVELQYAQIEDDGHSAGADAEGVQIRSVYKF